MKHNIDDLLINDIFESNLTNCIFINEYANLNKNILFKKSIEGVIFIIDNDYNLKGLLTDGDIRRFYSESNQNIDDYISWKPITISSSDKISFALKLLREKEINILSVSDNTGKHIGYVTMHKLLNYFSPERIYLEANDEIDDNKERHIARYKFALNFLSKNFKVLDSACGSGYGSEILSKQVKNVIGIDLSKKAIEFAESNHNSNNIQFMQEDIKNLFFENNTFDGIISFETIEHIPKEICLKYLKNISNWIKPGGMVILSSPMLRYKDNEPYVTNPYHINEMPKKELLDIFSNIFSNFEIHYYHQVQDVFIPLLDEHTGFVIVVARKKF